MVLFESKSLSDKFIRRKVYLARVYLISVFEAKSLSLLFYLMVLFQLKSLSRGNTSLSKELGLLLLFLCHYSTLNQTFRTLFRGQMTEKHAKMTEKHAEKHAKHEKHTKHAEKHAKHPVKPRG